MRENADAPKPADDSVPPATPTEASDLEFEDSDPFVSHRWRRLPRVARVALVITPVLLAITVVLTQTGQLRLPSASLSPQVLVAVECGVPWMTLSLDDEKQTRACHQVAPGAPITTEFLATVGSHTLRASAAGFVSEGISFTASQGDPPFVQVNLEPSADGSASMLAAANAYLANTGFVQRVALPAALWSDLNLSERPFSSYLVVEERFEVVALDPILPTYLLPNYLRPVTPQAGAVGATMVMAEQIQIFDGCSTEPLVRRETAIFSQARGNVIFSVSLNGKTWTAWKPYVLNLAPNSYAQQSILTASPAEPLPLLALAARSQLATLLGANTAVAGTVATAPAAGRSSWGGGVLLTDQSADAGAAHTPDWLYLGGLLFGLTSDAARLTPLAQPVSSALKDWVAAAQAPQMIESC